MPAGASIEVVELGRDERDDAVAVLTAAFVREPWLRWTFAASPDDPREMLRALQELSCDIRYEMRWPLYGARIDGRLAGVAGVTIPGGNWPASLDDAYAAFCAKIGPVATERLEAVSTLEQAHRPGPHNWDLGVIGVHPDAQRRGVARALLDVVHAGARQAPGSTGVYVSTADPANVPFYQRMGYHLLAEREVAPGIGFWALFRPHDKG
jgi:ribosomal protein S18 acetylase RimI-like enzyme